MNDILSLVYTYSRHNRLADRNFIDKLVEIVVKQKGLHNYVKRIKFVDDLSQDSDSLTCATYNGAFKQIKIDTDSVSLVLDRMSRYDGLFSEFEQVFVRNLYITYLLLHELEHANQFKIAEDKSNTSLEAQLSRVGFERELTLTDFNIILSVITDQITEEQLSDFSKERYELYSAYYKYAAIERMANIKALSTIVSSLQEVKKIFLVYMNLKMLLWENI